MELKEMELIINNCLHTTINRFREKPLYYFTESDIHSSLQGDLLKGNSKFFYYHNKISLVHLEYPTNFRYKKMQLLEGYPNTDYEKDDVINHETWFNNEYGDRGNFDLAILNKDFVEDSMKSHPHEEGIKRIINKDINFLKKRFNNESYGLKEIQKEVLYCFEIKFIHPFNARNINMLGEVIKDNEKLKLALFHSQGFIRPINLIFCSSESKQRKDEEKPIVERVQKYIEEGKIELSDGSTREIPSGVVNILIESYFDKNEKKITQPPILYCKQPKDWAKELINTFNKNL